MSPPLAEPPTVIGAQLSAYHWAHSDAARIRGRYASFDLRVGEVKSSRSFGDPREGSLHILMVLSDVRQLARSGGGRTNKNPPWMTKSSNTFTSQAALSLLPDVSLDIAARVMYPETECRFANVQRSAFN